MKIEITGRQVKASTVLLTVIAILALQITSFAQETWTRVPGHISLTASTSTPVAHTEASTIVPLAVALPLRNEAALDTLLQRLYDPKDPLYGHFLSSNDFLQQYAPTQADYNSVIAYVRAMGLTVTGTQPNRLVVDAVGTADQVENAFGVHLYDFASAQGLFHAPDADPLVASGMAGKISAIVGLDSSPMWTTHVRPLSPDVAAAIQPWQVGHGPGGALTPADIDAAYQLKNLTVSGTSTALNGAGQTIAVFELDGYKSTDIAAYCRYYGLRQIPLQNVMVDGYSGSAGGNAGEVTLDIELANAIAPGAAKILVYEAPNTGAGVIDEYARIASDNVAKQISTSWGLPETGLSSSSLNAENSIFKQMAAQGQTVFAASGDNGAYDNRSKLSVDDPASQPYVTGVGGTQLFVNSDGTYRTESTWNGGSLVSGAGGGGVSAYWAKPSWQSSFGVSKTNRNVPDVSLNADPFTGYSIYYNGGWYIFGGTSCAAPLWAGYTALINQQRAALGKSVIGYLNPVLYPIAAGARYSTDFHDIADGSTNLYYPATRGYDNATGWGSFNGPGLLQDLTGATPVPALAINGGPTVTPTVTSATIAWSTNVASTGSVSFGGAAFALSRTVSSAATLSSHSVTITGLLHGRTYYYVVSSSSASGSVTSAVKWFTTK